VNKKLAELTDRTRKAFGENLVSVILYGSAAMDDWNEGSSDLNILCVLGTLSTGDLAHSQPVFLWWREQGNSPPLLLTEEELRTSTDCFPMEFHDMQHHRRTLYGVDVIRDLVIDRKFYRAQVEHELRSKQIRLRQRSAEVLSQPDRLIKLLSDSISTFCVLGRHALILSGNEPRWKKEEIIAMLAAAMKTGLPSASEILAIRTSGKRLTQQDALNLLGGYLMETESLVRFVDGLSEGV
jgi:hypothetical protein